MVCDLAGKIISAKIYCQPGIYLAQKRGAAPAQRVIVVQ
jgi:hypothetical protein